MPRKKDPPPPLKKRLGLALWTFAGMEAAGARSINEYSDILDGRADGRDTGASTDCRRSLTFYSRGEHWPNDFMAPNSLVGRVEALYPGTRRYLTTSMWLLLDGEDLPADLLWEELASCPALQGYFGPSGSISLHEQALSLGELLEAISCDNPTFWTLEAVILLMALAVKAGDRPAGSAIFNRFREKKDKISLPQGIELRRRELLAFCVNFMDEPWGDVEAAEPTPALKGEPCTDTVPAVHLVEERVFGAASADLALNAERSPLAVLDVPMPEAPNRRLFRDGRYPRWAVALLSAILVPILAFAKSDTSVFYTFILLAFWVIITAAAFFPRVGRWSATW